MEKAFIFDWSGTINNNFDVFYKVIGKMFEELGGKVPEVNEVKDTFTIPYMSFWNHHFPELTQEEEEAMYLKYISEEGDAKIFDDAEDLINDLFSAGYKIFILSSDPISRLTRQVEKSSFSDKVGKVIGGVHDKNIPTKELVEEYNLDPENTFFIGDTSGDIEAGVYAGIKTIGIPRGFQSKEKLSRSNPTHLFHSLSEIRQLF